MGVIGRNELWNEGEEKDCNLRVEHIGPEAAPEDTRPTDGASRNTGLARILRQQLAIILGKQELDAHPHQIGSTQPFEHGERSSRGCQ